MPELQPSRDDWGGPVNGAAGAVSSMFGKKSALFAARMDLSGALLGTTEKYRLALQSWLNAAPLIRNAREQVRELSNADQTPAKGMEFSADITPGLRDDSWHVKADSWQPKPKP